VIRVEKEIYCNSHFCGLVTIKDKDDTIMMNESDWKKMGKIMGWKL